MAKATETSLSDAADALAYMLEGQRIDRWLRWYWPGLFT